MKKALLLILLSLVFISSYVQAGVPSTKIDKSGTDFKASDSPTFTFSMKDGNTFVDKSFSVSIIYLATGKSIPLPATSKTGIGQYSLTLNSRSFRAGKYKISFDADFSGSIVHYEDFFKWGLMAINTKQSTYEVGRAELEIVVLDNASYGACGQDLNVEIKVIDPLLGIKTYSRTKGDILDFVPDCGVFTLSVPIPQEGTYLISGKALDLKKDINDSMDTNFLVVKSIDVNIARFQKTKIDPAKDPQRVNLRITAINKKTIKEITEIVPSDFNISIPKGYASPSITDNGTEKRLTWLNLSDLDFNLAYDYRVPDRKPWLYYLGQIVVEADKNYVEYRPWQIAVDATSLFQSRAGTVFDNNTVVGNVPWLIDSNYSSASFIIVPNTSNYLQASGFNFNIPSSAIITGISAIMRRHATHNEINDRIQDYFVKIMKSGLIGGTNKGAKTNYLETDENKTYGIGTTDLWGLTGWTPAIINASNFGVAMSSQDIVMFDYTVNVAYIDYLEITVYYTDECNRTLNANWDLNSNVDCNNFAMNMGTGDLNLTNSARLRLYDSNLTLHSIKINKNASLWICPKTSLSNTWIKMG